MQLCWGRSELREAFKGMAPELENQLVRKKASFRFNSPSAPHFALEREVWSVKSALRAKLLLNHCWAPSLPRLKGSWMPNHLDTPQWMLPTLTQTGSGGGPLLSWSTTRPMSSPWPNSSSCLTSATQPINQRAFCWSLGAAVRKPHHSRSCDTACTSNQGPAGVRRLIFKWLKPGNINETHKTQHDSSEPSQCLGSLTETIVQSLSPHPANAKFHSRIHSISLSATVYCSSCIWEAASVKGLLTGAADFRL